MILSRLNFLLVFVLITGWVNAQTPEGELKRWHKISLTFEGPNTSEIATPNPFSDYALEVTFKHQGSNRSYTVPGYYAACDDAANTSCDTGNKWKVHFTPDQTGNWNWSVSFLSGSNVAISGGGSDAGFMNGDTGSFAVIESDKLGKDFRSKNLGRLKYVGEHYLQHVGTNPSNPNGPWFLKAGADAPENTLAYDDFDNTPNRGNRRKSWSPHQGDYVAADASGYTWNGGKGTELLGVVKYLSDKGVNAFSFLTLSLHGDDENVFPHLLKVTMDTYNGYGDEKQWNQGVHKNRFDVSKLAQWEKIFAYADKKGMYMHFKTMETENDNMMDNNTFGNERKLYYRELIARFGHHLALNWNLTEETTIPDDVTIATAAYIKSIDPYDHNIVLHTYPGQQDQKYGPLLGDKSALTGASIQMNKGNVHNVVREWVQKSNAAGKKWIVANDEQGNANIGIDQDGKEDKLVRDEVLWGTLMAGGAGVEYYYGYQTGETDLTAQNHRSRDLKYSDAARALVFFNEYLQEDLVDMMSSDNITSDTNDYVLSKTAKIYTVYRPNGGSTGLNLPSGNDTYQVQWYNPRGGSGLTAATTLGGNLVAPDANDWVAIIKKKGSTTGSCSDIAYTAFTDFPNITVNGFSPAYRDEVRNALGINAAMYKDTFAAAEMTFSGATGTYDITLNTLTEVDGESTYRLRVNGTLIGSYQNPSTLTDYVPASKIFENITMNTGDSVRVEFNSDTNGTISEGPSTAYSRGRWTGLDFVCSDGTTNIAPQVAVISPNTGTTIITGESLVLKANASDSDGTVSKVEFYVNGTSVGTDTTAPYQTTYTFNNTETYSITANATDDKGASTTSATVVIIVETENTDGDCVATEQNGIVAVEAEDFINQIKVTNRKWYAQDGNTTTPTPDPDPAHADGASGGSYIEILPDTRVTHDDPLVSGVSFSNTPGQVAVLSYKVKFMSPGKYFVWVRAHSTGTEDNGIHVGLNGNWPSSGQRMQWCAGKKQWTWESKQRTAAVHCGEAQKIYLDIPTAGIHTISFSMREDGFEMDKFVLSKAYTKPTGTGPQVVLTDCGNTNTAPQVVITSPTNGTNFIAGQSVTIKVNASDVDGTISKIDFFANGALLGTATTTPYQIASTFNNVGSYIITAEATDNDGLATISQDVIVEVENDTLPVELINIPGTFEAEDFDVKSGSVRIENTPATSNKNIGFIKNGDAVEYDIEVAATDEYTFDIYASSKGKGGTIDILEDGSLVSTINIPVTGQWHQYKKYSTSVNLTSGEKTLSFLFKGEAGYLYNIDRIVATSLVPIEETITLSPINDTYLDGAKRYNSDMVRVELNKRTGYLMFDLSTINGTITSADLKFTVFSDPGDGNLTIHKGTSSNWTENTLSIANKPAKGVKLGGLDASFLIGNIKTIPLKTTQMTDDKLSLILDVLSGNDFAFASKENGTVAKPQLVITYTTNRNGVNNSEDIKLFPNPVVNRLSLSGNLAGKRAKVFSLLGVLLKEIKLVKNQESIDMSDMPSGYYVITIIEANKANKILISKKVLKQ